MTISDRTELTELDAAPAWARERAEMLQGLYIHMLMYVLVNGGLLAINWLTRGDDGSWWFQWPLMIWGVGLVIHIVTAVVPVFSPGWVDRRAAELAERSRAGTGS